jgi:hypothetical protein
MLGSKYTVSACTALNTPYLTLHSALFKEHKEDINTTITKHQAESSDGGSHARMYQMVLKELWDEESDKVDYEKRAEN